MIIGGTYKEWVERQKPYFSPRNSTKSSGETVTVVGGLGKGRGKPQGVSVRRKVGSRSFWVTTKDKTCTPK